MKQGEQLKNKRKVPKVTSAEKLWSYTALRGVRSASAKQKKEKKKRKLIISHIMVNDLISQI